MRKAFLIPIFALAVSTVPACSNTAPQYRSFSGSDISYSESRGYYGKFVDYIDSAVWNYSTFTEYATPEIDGHALVGNGRRNNRVEVWTIYSDEYVPISYAKYFLNSVSEKW